MAEQLECFPGNLNIEYHRSGGAYRSLKIEKRLKNSYLWSKGIANYTGRGRPTQRVKQSSEIMNAVNAAASEE